MKLQMIAELTHLDFDVGLTQVIWANGKNKTRTVWEYILLMGAINSSLFTIESVGDSSTRALEAKLTMITNNDIISR